MPTKSKKVCTIAQAAALNFEACDTIEQALPSNEQWAHKLAYLKIAARLLTKSKPQLVKVLAEIDNAPGKELVENITSCSNFFHAIEQVFSAAEARLLCAGATLVQTQSKRQRAPLRRKAA